MVSSTPLAIVLWAVFAEDIRRLSTKAARVAIRPVASLMTSVESWLRWCLGSLARTDVPRTAPPKRHAMTMAAIESEFIATGPRTRGAGHERDRCARISPRKIERRREL